MPEILYPFRCYDCQKVTEVIQTVPETRKAGSGNQSKKIQVIKDCEHCKRQNIIEIPDWWDSSSPVLGNDKTLPGSSNAIPVIQGKKP